MHCFKFTSCGIELDAKLVVDLLKKEDGSPNNNDVIVADCKEGLKKILIIRITYSFRKINECIDICIRQKGSVAFPRFYCFFHFPT